MLIDGPQEIMTLHCMQSLSMRGKQAGPLTCAATARESANKLHDIHTWNATCDMET